MRVEHVELLGLALARNTRGWPELASRPYVALILSSTVARSSGDSDAGFSGMFPGAMQKLGLDRTCTSMMKLFPFSPWLLMSHSKSLRSLNHSCRCLWSYLMACTLNAFSFSPPNIPTPQLR